jgi:hypothetical protein
VSGYTKLFSSIVSSTVWREPANVRLVWITMLAMSDRDGMVEASIPGLADLARVSLPECLAALERLAGPDEYSRSKEFEGRRIVEVDGGWQLVNHRKYREKMSLEERRDRNAEYMRDYRKRGTTVEEVGERKPVSLQISEVEHADAEASPAPEAAPEANTDCSPAAPARKRANRKPVIPPDVIGDAFEAEPELVSALAGECQCTEQVIRARVPAFVFYWRKEGTRRSPKGWQATFANRIRFECQKGWLHPNEPKSGVMRTAQALSPAMEKLRREAMGDQ